MDKEFTKGNFLKQHKIEEKGETKIYLNNKN
jgi:hypothetical protein